MIATNISGAAVSMAEAQAYARVETGEEEALLAGLVRTASALCESFTGQVAWAGQDGSLACFSEGGWRFVPPADGMSLVDRVSGQLLSRRDGAWETGIVRAQEIRVDGQTVVRNRQSAIVDPSGGMVVDSQCRAAVAQILAAIRAHGLIS